MLITVVRCWYQRGRLSTYPFPGTAIWRGMNHRSRASKQEGAEELRNQSPDIDPKFEGRREVCRSLWAIAGAEECAGRGRSIVRWQAGRKIRPRKIQM